MLSVCLFVRLSNHSDMEKTRSDTETSEMNWLTLKIPLYATGTQITTEERRMKKMRSKKMKKKKKKKKMRDLEKIQTRKKHAPRENALRENALVNDDLTNVRSNAGMDPGMTRMASAMI